MTEAAGGGGIGGFGIAGIISGGLGAISGIAGSAIQANESRRAAEAQRDYLTQIRRENIDLSDRKAREQYERSLVELNDARRQQADLLGSSRTAANQQALGVFGSDAYQGFAKFVSDSMSGRLPDALRAQVTGQFRGAQEARGLSGAAASRDESRAWGAYLYQNAQQMLPLARQIAMDPFELVNRAQMADIGKVQAAQQVGSGSLQQYLSAAGGAQNIASQQVNPLLGVNTNLASQVPFSTASPLAGGLGALSTGLGSLGGLLAGGGLGARPDEASASNYGTPGGQIGPTAQGSAASDFFSLIQGNR